LARVFRDCVKAEDRQFDKTALAIAAPLRTRLKRHPRLRHEQIAGTIQRWRASIPATFRLGDVDVVPERDAFSLSENRLTATWMAADEWDDPDYREPGVAIARFSLTLHLRRLNGRWTPSAVISLHALARAIERSGLRDHDLLTAELAVLASAPADGEEVATPSGGYWIGGRIATKGKDGTATVRAVRTYHF
jgi:hypothetical protein